jgi:hypothetical protein
MNKYQKEFLKYIRAYRLKKGIKKKALNTEQKLMMKALGKK